MLRSVQCANDLGQFLGAVVEAHRDGAGRRCRVGTEAPENVAHHIALRDLGGHRLHRGTPDLGLERVRRALGDDLAGVDDRDALRERIGFLEVLGCQEDRHTVLVGEAGHLVPERRPALDVEAGGRLVQEQQSRLVYERERQVESALHPAGVAADLAVGRIGQAHAVDQLIAAALRLGAGEAVHAGLEAHVLTRSQERVERRLL